MAKAINELLHQEVTLTTKSDIRYEGRLIGYDAQNWTITLNNVRNFGTEDRDTLRKIEADPKVYDQIIFNAQGISRFDLVLRNVIRDPAIIAAHGANNRFQARHKPTPTVSELIGSTMNNGRIRNIDPKNLMKPNGGRKGNNNNRRRDQSRDGRRRDDRPKKSGGRHVSFSVEKPSKNDNRGRMGHIPHVPRSALGRHNNRDNKKKDGQSRRSRNGGLETPGKFAAPKKTEKFDDEFDFEGALEKFKELKVNDESTQNDEKKEGKQAIYEFDQFFDNFSLANDAEKPKRTRKDEKEANRETFGIVQIRPRRKYSDRRRGKFNGRSNRRPVAAH